MIGAARLLQFRRLRRQPLRAAIACVSVAAGVALAVSIVVVATSINRSYDEFGTGFAGRAALRVVGATPAGLDEGLVSKVEGVSGVATAVPVVQAVTLERRDPGARVPALVLGVDCRAESIFGKLGCNPAALARARDTDPPLVSPAVVRDEWTTLRTSEGRIPLANAVMVKQLGALGGGPVAVFPLTVAQRLFSRVGRLDAIYVVPHRGVDVGALEKRLRSAIGGWNGVLPATAPPPIAKLVVGTFIPLFAVLAVLGLGIGAVLVYDTVTLSMEERRLQLAIVSALGGTRRTLMGGALVEAGALGLAGGLLGVPGGFLLAGPSVRSLNGFTQNLVALPIRVHWSLLPVVGGAAIGVAMSLVGAWIAARRALRIDVSAELSNRGLRAAHAPANLWRRAGITTGCALAGLATCELAQRGGALHAWQPPAAMAGLLLSTLAFTLAVGAWAPLVVRRLKAFDTAPAPIQLALANLVREPGRTGVMVVAVGSAVGMAFMVASFTTSIGHGIRKGITAGTAGRVRVSTLPASNSVNVEARLSPQFLERLRGVPGVAGVDRAAALMLGTSANDIIGVIAFEHPVMSRPLLAGSKDLARFERGDGAMIGAGLARGRHLRPGSTVRLPTATGFVGVRVLGIWQDGDFNGKAVTVPMAFMDRVWGKRSPQEVFVRPQRGVSADELRSRIAGAQLDPDIRVQTPARLAKLVANDVSTQLAAFWAAQRALVAVAFVAVLSTLLLVGVQRRRELATLVAVGMRSGQLGRMVSLEAGIVALVGAILGPLAGVAMFEASRQILPIFIGFHDPFHLDLSAIVLYAPITIAVVLLASVLPAWRASQLEVVPALQYE